MTTLPAIPRGPVVDARTGSVSAPWLQFFEALRRAILSGIDDAETSVGTVQTSVTALAAQVADLLADDEPDAELEARLQLLETGYAFTPGTGSAGAAEASALAIQLAALADTVDALALRLALIREPPDWPRLRDLEARITALEPLLLTEAGAFLTAESGARLRTE